MQDRGDAGNLAMKLVQAEQAVQQRIVQVATGLVQQLGMEEIMLEAESGTERATRRKQMARAVDCSGLGAVDCQGGAVVGSGGCRLSAHTAP